MPASAAQKEKAAAEYAALFATLDTFTEESADDERIMALIERWAVKYSERNATLIVMQRPSATDLKSYRGWLAEGRQVKKGQKGIRILAPSGQATVTDAKTGEDKAGRKFFRLISVFDIRQTEPVSA